MENTEIAEQVVEVEETAESLKAKVEELEYLNRRLENDKSELVERMNNRHESYNSTVDSLRRSRQVLERKLAQERQVIARALGELHKDKEEFTLESPEILAILKRALRIGHLIGFRSEVSGMAERLGLYEFYRDEVSNIDRPTEQEAIDNAIGEQVIAHSEIHPLDPRAQSVWRKCAMASAEMGLCSEYERVAEKLGIPTDFELDYDGWVEVSFSGYARIPVSGTAVRGGDGDGVSSYDLLENVDMTEFIRDNVEWEVDDSYIEWVSED